MRFGMCIACAVVLLILQSLFYHLGVPSWATPQGLLVCVVFLAFHEFSIVGVVLAFVLGLMLDMSSGIALGPWAGSYTLVYAVFAFLSQRLFVESKLVAMVVVITATLLAGGVFLALAYEYQKLSQDDLLTLGGQGVTSALITPAVFGVLSRIWRRSRLHGLHGNTVISAV